jgi:hypothetical protein
MQIKNIDRLLLFREDGKKRILTLEQLRSKYRIEADGTINYFPVNQDNVDNYRRTGIALNPSHLEFFEAFKKSILAGAADEKSLICYRVGRVERPFNPKGRVGTS